MSMVNKLRILCSRYESLTRVLAAPDDRSPSYIQWLKDRRQVVANQIWEVKQWLYTH